jgi:sarcosine oxidase subunit alpha
MEDVPDLAAARLAEGQPALTRSFRLHRRRGAFCQAGWCQQCRVRLADGRIALACRQEPGPLAADRPWRRIAGLVAERLPPWFYETRLLRPRLLRQFYLGRLRRLSAAPPLPPTPRPAAGTWSRRRCDVLVVGGGLAGLAAAAERAGAGRRVLLVETEASLGGRARFQPQRRQELSAAFAASGMETLLRTLCAGLYPPASETLLIGPDGPILVGFDELVVATGAYDRLLPCRGNDLPGVVGLQAFERLVARGAVPGSWRVGVVADADGAAAALATGRSLAWIAGPDDLPDAPCARFPGTTLVAIEGRQRVRQARLDPGGAQSCDLLVMGFRQPTYELQVQAGQAVGLAGEPATIVVQGEAAVPLTVVGAAATAPATAPRPAARPAPEAMLCPCEDVRRGDLDQAIADGFAEIELGKRRTGAGTGPCQGKLCHPELLACFAAAGRPPALPTIRPLLRPVSLAELAAADHE